jgi:hypothetical protein
MSLVATTSSTCKRVTGEGSGFRGARALGENPALGSLIPQARGTCLKTLGLQRGSGWKGGIKGEGGCLKPVAI